MGNNKFQQDMTCDASRFGMKVMPLQNLKSNKVIDHMLLEAEMQFVPLWWDVVCKQNMNNIAVLLIPQSIIQRAPEAMISDLISQPFFFSSFDTRNEGVTLQDSTLTTGQSLHYPNVSSMTENQKSASVEAPHLLSRQVTWGKDEGELAFNILEEKNFASYLLPLDSPGILIDATGQKILLNSLPLRKDEKLAIEDARRCWYKRRRNDINQICHHDVYGKTRCVFEKGVKALSKFWKFSLSQKSLLKPIINARNRLRMKVFLLQNQKPLSPKICCRLQSLKNFQLKEHYLNVIWNQRLKYKNQGFSFINGKRRKSIKCNRLNKTILDSSNNEDDADTKHTHRARQERYNVEEEARETALWSPLAVPLHPLILLPTLLSFAVLGGNPFLAGNSIKFLLISNQCMGWMSTYEANFHLNNILASSLGLYFLFLPVNYWAVNRFGPKRVVSSAFFTMAVGWILVGHTRTPLPILLGLSCVGVGTSAVFLSVQCLSNIFAMERQELHILCLVTLCDGLGMLWPKTAEMFVKLENRSLHNSAEQCLLIAGCILMMAAVASYFCFPNAMPPPRMRPLLTDPFEKRIKNDIFSRCVTLPWTALLSDTPSRYKFFGRGADPTIGIRILSTSNKDPMLLKENTLNRQFNKCNNNKSPYNFFQPVCREPKFMPVLQQTLTKNIQASYTAAAAIHGETVISSRPATTRATHESLTAGVWSKELQTKFPVWADQLLFGKEATATKKIKRFDKNIFANAKKGEAKRLHSSNCNLKTLLVSQKKKQAASFVERLVKRKAVHQHSKLLSSFKNRISLCKNNNNSCEFLSHIRASSQKATELPFDTPVETLSNKGNLLHSTLINPLAVLQNFSEYNTSISKFPIIASPTLWKVSPVTAAFQPQTWVICIALTIIQFACLERFLHGHNLVNSISLHVNAANYYQYLFDLVFPLGSYGIFNFLITAQLQNFALQWRQIVAVLVFMCLFATASLGISLIRRLWLQLVSMGCIMIIYPMLQGLPLAAFLYIYGPNNANTLVCISTVARGLACFLWVLWQSFTIITFGENNQSRLQIASIIAIVGMLCTVILYMLDPATYDSEKYLDSKGHYKSYVLQRPVRVHVLGLPILPQQHAVQRCFAPHPKSYFDCFGRELIL